MMMFVQIINYLVCCDVHQIYNCIQIILGYTGLTSESNCIYIYIQRERERKKERVRDLDKKSSLMSNVPPNQYLSYQILYLILIFFKVIISSVFLLLNHLIYFCFVSTFCYLKFISQTSINLLLSNLRCMPLYH